MSALVTFAVLSASRIDYWIGLTGTGSEAREVRRSLCKTLCMRWLLIFFVCESEHTVEGLKTTAKRQKMNKKTDKTELTNRWQMIKDNAVFLWVLQKVEVRGAFSLFFSFVLNVPCSWMTTESRGSCLCAPLRLRNTTPLRDFTAIPSTSQVGSGCGSDYQTAIVVFRQVLCSCHKSQYHSRDVEGGYFNWGAPER